MCPFCADRFFVSNTVLCGPLGRIRSRRGVIFFDCFLRELFPIASPGKDQRRGPQAPSLAVQGDEILKRRGTAPAGAFRSATKRSEALSAEINRNPPSLKCVFGYFLHKQKVTEVPGRAALGDGVTARAAIKSKTNRNPPQKIKKKMVA